jgi:recombination endonuclease VII
MGKWVHRLLEYDLETKKGTCANCGPVKIKTSGGRIRCRVAFKEIDRNCPGYQEPKSGTCPLCEDATELVWDHDHATGAGRGHICRRCNAVLGMARDNPSTLRAAALYLEKERAALWDGSSLGGLTR